MVRNKRSTKATPTIAMFLDAVTVLYLMLVEQFLFFKPFFHFYFVITFMFKENRLFSQLDSLLGTAVKQVPHSPKLCSEKDKSIFELIP